MTDSPKTHYRLPHLNWFALATVVLFAAYGGIHWHFFRTGPVLGDEWTGVQYLLDYERAVVHAKLWNMPVFVYFTGINCTNGRRMEKSVLRAPAVIERLRKFICVESFVDSVPRLVVTDPEEAARLLAQNVKLQEDWLGDVTLPSSAIMDPVFFREHDTEQREPIAKAIGLITEEAEFIRFLDDALEKWENSRSSERQSLPASAGQ